MTRLREMAWICDWSLGETFLASVSTILSRYLSFIRHRGLVDSRILFRCPFHCSIVLDLVVVQFSLINAGFYIKFIFIHVAFFIELPVDICSFKKFTFFKSFINFSINVVVVKPLARLSIWSCHGVSSYLVIVKFARCHLVCIFFERVLIVRITARLRHILECLLEWWPLRLIDDCKLLLNFRYSLSALLMWVWDVNLHCVQLIVLICFWNCLICTWKNWVQSWRFIFDWRFRFAVIKRAGWLVVWCNWNWIIWA